MVYINEWLPNPAGTDATGEWVEFFNGGNVPVSLSGWTLQAGSKKVNLSGTIGAGEYVVFKRTSTKLTLRNTDEKLFLYDASGRLVDESAFLGSATDGKSFSRIDYNGNNVQHFVWSDPTPGAQNKNALDVGLVRNTYAAGVALNPGFGGPGFAILLLGTSIILTAIVLYAFKKHENLSKLFFGRDEAI
jgi:hypothetical protein